MDPTGTVSLLHLVPLEVIQSHIMIALPTKTRFRLFLCCKDFHLSSCIPWLGVQTLYLLDIDTKHLERRRAQPGTVALSLRHPHLNRLLDYIIPSVDNIILESRDGSYAMLEKICALPALATLSSDTTKRFNRLALPFVPDSPSNPNTPSRTTLDSSVAQHPFWSRFDEIVLLSASSLNFYLPLLRNAQSVQRYLCHFTNDPHLFSSWNSIISRLTRCVDGAVMEELFTGEVPTIAGSKAISARASLLGRLWLHAGALMIGSHIAECLTPFHYACWYDQDGTGEILEGMIRYGGIEHPDSLRRDEPASLGLTPLHVAIGTKNVDSITLLLKNTDSSLYAPCLSAKIPGGLNALELAAGLQLHEILDLIFTTLPNLAKEMAPEQVLRLFSFAQQPHLLRSNDPWQSSHAQSLSLDDNQKKSLLFDENDSFDTVKVLFRHLKRAGRALATITHPETGANFFHFLNSSEPIQLLKDATVDPFVVNNYGQTALEVVAAKIVAPRSRALFDALMALYELRLPLPRPETVSFRHLLRLIAEAHYFHEFGLAAGSFVRLEQQMWEQAAPEDTAHTWKQVIAWRNTNIETFDFYRCYSACTSLHPITLLFKAGFRHSGDTLRRLTEHVKTLFTLIGHRYAEPSWQHVCEVRTGTSWRLIALCVELSLLQMDQWQSECSSLVSADTFKSICGVLWQQSGGSAPLSQDKLQLLRIARLLLKYLIKYGLHEHISVAAAAAAAIPLHQHPEAAVAEFRSEIMMAANYSQQ